MDDHSYDYSRLPTLVLNEIFGYLSIKERIKCKSVCRAWKMEIELKEKTRDTLVFHIGPYLWNVRWTHTNNRGLMKFENSFEAKRLLFLQHPRSRTLLKKIKKLAIVNHHPNALNAELSNTKHWYIHFCEACEVMEIRGFALPGTVTFELPKLKVLVIREGTIDKLVLNCPSLELLHWNWSLKELCFRTTKSLKRLFCFRWRVSSNVKFETLEYLNLFIPMHELVSDRLLGQMPKLKRFVLNSNSLEINLKRIRAQQKRYGRDDLEVLCCGFRDPAEFSLTNEGNCFVKFEECVDELFENYTKLVENWPWKVWIDYSKLFNKFKILPSDFFERFFEPYGIEISAVSNYIHLFEFLRCYPFVERMKIHWRSVEANRILDMVQLLNPSLTELTIVEENSSHVLDIDLTFLRLFKFVVLEFIFPRLPVEFIRRVAAKRGPHLTGFMFIDLATYHRTVIYFFPWEYAIHDFSCGSKFLTFPSLEQLIDAFRAHPHLKRYLCDV